MTFRYDDRIKATIASAIGTGVIPFNSPALTGYLPFTSITSIATADVVPYALWDGAGNWEEGYGTWTAGTGLARPTVVSRNSAGTTARINFTNPTTAWCSAHKATLALLDSSGNLTLPGALAAGGNITNGGAFGIAAGTGGISSGGVIVAATTMQAGGNISTTAGDVIAPGASLVHDSGGGGQCNVTGFGLGASLQWNGLIAQSAFTIQAGGSGGVQLTNGATSWAAVSDYRAKKDYGLVPHAMMADIVRDTPVHVAAMNDNPNVLKAMFIAHELQATIGYAVHGEKDGPEMQKIDTTDPLVPVMWATIQYLLARVEALEKD